MRHSPCDKQQLAKTLGLRTGICIHTTTMGIRMPTQVACQNNRQINNMAKSTSPSQRSKVT